MESEQITQFPDSIYSGNTGEGEYANTKTAFPFFLIFEFSHSLLGYLRSIFV